ncbi:GNAT family N-acetyltransferase [Pararhizobium sp.]|uniref:GNAT family N-acetyltransferase n=1 Tax=Pararhizobium sp. TaxID=1977563 RepID=UPI003D123A49
MIKVVKLCYCSTAVNFITNHYMRPDILQFMPDNCRDGFWLHKHIEGLRTGQKFFYVPTLGDAEPIGLFNAYWLNASIMEVHQGVHQEYRKGWSIPAAKACMEECTKDNHPKFYMGLTPVTYPGAIMVAIKCGFRRQGIFPKYLSLNGERVDVQILVKENGTVSDERGGSPQQNND